MSGLYVVTGAAGFIGFHISRRLLERGDRVIGVDNLNSYYDPRLKEARRDILLTLPRFQFLRLDIADKESLWRELVPLLPDEDWVMIHLAAQAGVRYSLVNPDSYIASNLVGTFNLLEIARQKGCRHFLYASSSSVYGGNRKLPFSTNDNVDHPISLYAATKKSNELMAHVYAYTYNIPCTGLRLFTVYGPWGRPDMSLYIFTAAILKGEPIPLYNFGKSARDFTYIDDVVEGCLSAASVISQPDQFWDPKHPHPARSWVPYRIYNIGNSRSIPLMSIIELLEKCLGKKAIVDLQPLPVGDVPETHADITDSTSQLGFIPRTPIEEGIPRFVEWFRWYHQV